VREVDGEWGGRVYDVVGELEGVVRFDAPG